MELFLARTHQHLAGALLNPDHFAFLFSTFSQNRGSQGFLPYSLHYLDIFSLPFFLNTCFFVPPLLPFSFLSFFIFWILSLSLNFVVTTRHLNCQTFETRPCLNLALCQLWQHSRKVSMLASDQRLVNRLHCYGPGLAGAGLGTFVTGGSLLAASAAKLVWNCSAILQTAAAELLRATGLGRGRGWSELRLPAHLLVFFDINVVIMRGLLNTLVCKDP